MKTKIPRKVILSSLIILLVLIFFPNVPTTLAASETPLEIIRETAEVLEDMDISLDSGMFRSVLKKLKG